MATLDNRRDLVGRVIAQVEGALAKQCAAVLGAAIPDPASNLSGYQQSVVRYNYAQATIHNLSAEARTFAIVLVGGLTDAQVDAIGSGMPADSAVDSAVAGAFDDLAGVAARYRMIPQP